MSHLSIHSASASRLQMLCLLELWPFSLLPLQLLFLKCDTPNWTQHFIQGLANAEQTRRIGHDVCFIAIYIPSLFNLSPICQEHLNSIPGPACRHPLSNFCLFANVLNAVAMLSFRLLMKTDPDHWHSAALSQCSETCRFTVGKHRRYYFLF